MARERKRVWGELAAYHLAGVVANLPLTGRELDIQEIHPYRGDEPEDPGVARVKAFIAKRMWAAMTRTANRES